MLDSAGQRRPFADPRAAASAPLALAERASVQGEIARFRALAQTGYAMGFVAHVLFLAAFVVLDETWFAAFNVASLAVYVASLALLRRGHVIASFMLAWAEVIVHQVWAAQVFGLDSGFQYYLLVVAIGGGLLPTPRQWTRWLVASVPILVLLGLVLAGQAWSPARVPPPGWALTFALVNLAGLAVVLLAVVLSYALAAATAEQALEGAYRQSEGLLANILPQGIVARLKARPGTVADRFDSVTILFADIVGFTRLAETRSPDALVELLDRLFGRFDELAAAHGVEKIKTIGDAWMGVAGVPEPVADHAVRAAEMALAMRAEVAQLNRAVPEPLRLRIGIASGPVVAGVIGQSRFAYDLWGDAVNVAARMESDGLPDEVQVSAATWMLLRDRYAFEPRAPIEIKGKGRVQTYLLRGRRDGG